MNETKKRLLDAAECLFSQKGFDEVSVRELAAEADVNVAAVNYHFQGKENLFEQVVLRRFVKQRDRSLNSLQQVLSESGARPALRPILESLVREYLAGALSDPTGPSFMKCMAREMNANDRQGSSAFFQEMVLPIFKAYSQAISQACPHLNPSQISWTMASVIGQIHHFVMRWVKKSMLEEGSPNQELMIGIFPVLGQPVDTYVREVTDHITKFSAAAIETLYPEDTE